MSTEKESSTMARDEERRRHLRIPMTVVRARLGDGPKTFFGYARDISCSGMGIGTLTPKEPGSRHQLEFTLPSPLSRTVVCQCEVIWTRGYSKSTGEEPGMGLRFLDLDSQLVATIDTWIHEETWPPAGNS